MTDKQHEQDLQRVSAQNTFTDFTRHAEEPSSANGGFLRRAIDGMVREVARKGPYADAVHGRTNFDKHSLNAMIDLVEQTNPEDLESSGKALWDARDAITEAAKELDGHIEKVHWVGESGEAFRKWGRSLVTSTYGLSDFAGGAGDQITAAAVGLAAVRKAMPPRDTRPFDKVGVRPNAMPVLAQTESNPDYVEAKRVEKNRQEAINQMNRLSSYYAVANEQLVALQNKTPTFESMPDVGVPKPVSGYEKRSQSVSPSQGTATGAVSGANPQTATFSAGHAGTNGALDTPLPPQQAAGKIPYPDAPTVPTVGTSIDSVGTLPPATTPPVTGHTPSVPAGPVAAGTTNFPGGDGYGLPLPSAAGLKEGRTPGGMRTPGSAQGLAGKTGTSNSVPGRAVGTGQGPLGQLGKSASTGQSAARGTTGGARSLPMGPGVTGGTPRASGVGTPRTAGGPATGAGRSSGVVGGRPTAAPAGAKGTGRQIPRGTVVGAGKSASPHGSAGRPPQRGVVGAPQPSAGQGAGATGSRVAPGKSAAVTSKPAARTSASGAERNGMTRGGAGLRRGPGDQGKPGDRRETGRARRQDREVEEEAGTDLPTEPRRDTLPGSN
ncbi:hypothetical protein [Streptomyces sp. JHA26]|uniref:hypothetical protein n=1 Tax=Streptomyces sp. JHA26 TaxID=1917143 RepID=UPI000989DACA|nr:hypothetical protein [Streptomyces sp. JHA26]